VEVKVLEHTIPPKDKLVALSVGEKSSMVSVNVLKEPSHDTLTEVRNNGCVALTCWEPGNVKLQLRDGTVMRSKLPVSVIIAHGSVDDEPLFMGGILSQEAVRSISGYAAKHSRVVPQIMVTCNDQGPLGIAARWDLEPNSPVLGISGSPNAISVIDGRLHIIVPSDDDTTAVEEGSSQWERVEELFECESASGPLDIKASGAN